ncbi:Na+/H+ antiporter subunit G [Corynebacterium liangguodongii]|uniref:Na+/H+ antiporter subunit G n=1 Tax=Corynebacterium liangguodongii TaxID=2079535 RepID=A0A2S0WBR9_9CORY|nr:Na+/H+ antiporter subunit G [Corynebacterium liangguodongii]AWB83207.1 Na+/H+ antiporter subunit G [Corynebacterium liangguodongii]PWB98802.1 Na+/H+ antiporter subunit G [Corynebacterium liangguodongii]
MTIAEIISSLLVILATVCVVATTILQLRAPDALTRVNLMGPLVVVAFPLLIAAKLCHTWSTSGFSVGETLRAVLAIAAVWVAASVASFVMGRSLYGVTVVDRESGAEGAGTSFH